MPPRRTWRPTAPRRATCWPTARSTSSRPPRRIRLSPDVQHGFAGEFAIDQAAGDRADFAPRRLDRDLRPQFLRLDHLGQQSWSDAGALDANQLVEQGEPVELHPAGAEEPTALKSRAARL